MGKGGRGEKPDEKLEVLVDGRYYDVTSLKHPGGSIIKFYAGKGIDASEAFANFHLRSRKAKKLLDVLPSRAADASAVKKNLLPGQGELLEDFKKLTSDLENEGYFKPAPGHVVYRVLEIVAMHVIGVVLLYKGLVVPGLFILGLAQGRCGWLMHEGGHYSLTGNINIDRTLQVIIYGVGCGMSGGWWRNQHNKHHSMPQKLGHDVDLDTLPLVAFTSKVVKRIGSFLKLWLSLQAFLFPIITTTLVALGWQLYLHPRHIARTKNMGELFALVSRYVLWTYFITFKYGLQTSTLYYLIYVWFGSNYIFINFAVSHTHLDVVPKDDTQVDWVRYAAIYTMNVHPGPFKFISWWMSYLNFQIEHHLYPSMPQFRHPKISKRVKALFEKHGLKYDQRSYVEAIGVTFKNLHKVGSDVFLG